VKKMAKRLLTALLCAFCFLFIGGLPSAIAIESDEPVIEAQDIEG
jgi:hypothetical protein